MLERSGSSLGGYCLGDGAALTWPETWMSRTAGSTGREAAEEEKEERGRTEERAVGVVKGEQALQKARVERAAAMAGLEAFPRPSQGAYLGRYTAGIRAAFPVPSLTPCPAGFGAGEARGLPPMTYCS